MTGEWGRDDTLLPLRLVSLPRRHTRRKKKKTMKTSDELDWESERNSRVLGDLTNCFNFDLARLCKTTYCTDIEQNTKAKKTQGSSLLMTRPLRMLLSLIVRGTIVNRTYGIPKNLYIYLFLSTIVGPTYYGLP